MCHPFCQARWTTQVPMNKTKTLCMARPCTTSFFVHVQCTWTFMFSTEARRVCALENKNLLVVFYRSFRRAVNGAHPTNVCVCANYVFLITSKTVQSDNNEVMKPCPKVVACNCNASIDCCPEQRGIPQLIIGMVYEFFSNCGSRLLLLLLICVRFVATKHNLHCSHLVLQYFKELTLPN